MLDLPSPVPAPRDSLRHIKFKVSKSWLAGAAWASIIALGGWVASSIPLVWSWEKHQVTDGQLAHVLSGPAHTAFDEQLLPTEGVLDRLKLLEDASSKLQIALTAQQKVSADLRALLVDQYRWRVRWQAADAERDPRKRMDSANRAEAKFKRAISGGVSVDEAFRDALSINPYDLR